jgi:hypothetical protein
MCDTDALALVSIAAPITTDSLTTLLDETSSTADVLAVLCQWLIQDFYFACSNRRFNTATDFVDVTDYQDPSSNKYGHQVAQVLLGSFDPTWASVQDISANFQALADAKTFSFPVITNVDAGGGYVTIALRLPTSSIDGLEDQVSTWLYNFYGDSQWGAYTTTLDGDMTTLSDPEYLAGTLARNDSYNINYTAADGSGTTPLLYGFTLDMKLSFLPALYQLISEATGTGDYPGSVRTPWLSILSPSDFAAIRVDESVPYPVPTPSIGTQTYYCASEDDCNCLYFCVFRSLRTSGDMPLTTPAHNLYVNRFQEPNCLCYVSRAAPYGAIEILSPFGLCFDQNCLDPTVDRADFDATCSEPCNQAQDILSDVNWQDNFINPAAVNTDLVTQTCGLPVSDISIDRDRWRLVPALLIGAVCLAFCVPSYLLGRALLAKRYVFSGWHPILFLLTSGVGALAVYALAGKYQCQNTLEQLDAQAGCVDRLTGTLPLTAACCDADAPVFCQCDPESSVQQVCRSAVATDFCKCQNNGLCVPTSGSGDIIKTETVQSTTFNQHHGFLLLTIFALFTPLATLGIAPFLTRWHITSIGIHGLFYILLILACLSLLVVIPFLLLYTLAPDQRHIIDMEAQSQVCAVTE